MLSKSTVEHPGETHQNEREIKLDLDRWIRSFLHFSVVISTFYRINKVLPFDRLNKAAFISSKMARYSWDFPKKNSQSLIFHWFHGNAEKSSFQNAIKVWFRVCIIIFAALRAKKLYVSSWEEVARKALEEDKITGGEGFYGTFTRKINFCPTKTGFQRFRKLMWWEETKNISTQSLK